MLDEIADRGVDQHVDDACERLGMAIGQQPRRRLIRRAAPGDHVSRNRPWCAAKSDQRHRWIEVAPHPAQRLVDRREFRIVCLCCECRNQLRRIERIEPWSFADFKANGAAERVRNHQDVGEDDRGIELEAADRLQRHLGRVVRRETEIEEAAGLGAQLAILRQVTSRLSHHPDRRHALALAAQDLHEGLRHGRCGRGRMCQSGDPCGSEHDSEKWKPLFGEDRARKNDKRRV